MPTDIEEKDGDEPQQNKSSNNFVESLLSSDDNNDDDDEQQQTQQEKKADQDLAKRKRKQDLEFENKLKHIISNPTLWGKDSNRYLREFCNTVESNHDLYPHMMGDRDVEIPTNVGEQYELTKGYIKAISEHKDTTAITSSPVLYVLSRKTEYEDQLFEGFSTKAAPPIKFTHVRLMDGDGNQMYGRFATQISDQGKQLKRDGGDIIRMDIYTEHTHKLNGATSRMPCVFITKYSTVGYRNAPPVDEVHPPIPANEHPSNDQPPQKKTKSSDTSDDQVDCCPSNRHCSKHGVSFIVCICDSIPVESLDLLSIKEDCYFATDKMEDMPNNHKRNMLYWYYATNIYSICGKGKRKELPKCLVHKIRQCYPSDEYCGYEHHNNMHNT